MDYWGIHSHFNKTSYRNQTRKMFYAHLKRVWYSLQKKENCVRQVKLTWAAYDENIKVNCLNLRKTVA